MGWASAGQIFDPVARTLIELKAPDETKRRVLGDLIDVLQDGDWDTEDESLEQFKDDPAIVAAFRDHDVYILCNAENGDGSRSCASEQGHEDDHADWAGVTWPR